MKKLFVIGIFLLSIVSGIVFARQSSTNSQPAEIASISQESPLPSPAQNIGKPTKLVIEKIGVNADVEYVGLDDQGRMDVPKDADNVAWYNLGAEPGKVGNAVMAGHLDDVGGLPAVFWDLEKLEIGDQITTVDESGENYTFEVVDSQIYPFDQFPLQEVFGASEGQMLNLITCDGSFDQSAKNYSQRRVVYAKMVI